MKMNKDEEYTQFTGQPVRLRCVDPSGRFGYSCNDFGIRRFAFNGDGEKTKIVSVMDRPLTIVQRIRDIEAGSEKITLAFSTRPVSPDKTAEWERVTIDRALIASNTTIVKLSNYGILIDSNNARDVMRYLSDLLSLNPEAIPVIRGCSRLGWIDSGKRFLPFSEGVAFSGDATMLRLFEAIREAGSPEAWTEAATKLCRNGAAHIALTASFASALIGAKRMQPFFIHLWGLSGLGKTVCLQLAASVWGDPSVYVRSFNSTIVGMERTAGFLCNLPLILDELQLSRDKTGRVLFDPYFLTEGQGRGRGGRYGGLEALPRWNNTIISSGETRLISDRAASGAKNRAIEVELTGEVLTGTPERARTINIINGNYGHMGRRFVEHLMRQNPGEINDLLDEFRGMFNGVTGKQREAGAVLVTADLLRWNTGILPEIAILDPEAILPSIKTDQDTNKYADAAAYIISWMTEHAAEFAIKRKDMQIPRPCFGIVLNSSDSKYPGRYLLKRKYTELMEGYGADPGAALRWMSKNGIIQTFPKRSNHYSTNYRDPDTELGTEYIVFPFSDEPGEE